MQNIYKKVLEIFCLRNIFRNNDFWDLKIGTPYFGLKALKISAGMDVMHELRIFRDNDIKVCFLIFLLECVNLLK